MASTTMADLLKQAEDAGISSYAPENGQTYDLEVIGANAGRTKNGDPKFGVHLRVIAGPDSGKSFWTNYNLRAVKANGEPNSMGLALTFKDLALLGAPSEVIAGWDVDAADASEKVAAALKGTRVSAEAAVSGDFVNLKKIKPLSGGAVPPPAAPAPAPAAAPAAASPKPF